MVEHSLFELSPSLNETVVRVEGKPLAECTYARMSSVHFKFLGMGFVPKAS